MAKVTLDQGAFKQSADSVNRVISMVITIIIIVVVLMVVWKIYKAAKKGSEILGQQAGTAIISAQTGIPKERLSFIDSIANQIATHVTKIRFTNIVVSVNENAVIAALNQLLSAGEAKYCSDIFRQNTGLSLLQDVVKGSFNETEMKRVKPEILKGLN